MLSGTKPRNERLPADIARDWATVRMSQLVLEGDLTALSLLGAT